MSWQSNTPPAATTPARRRISTQRNLPIDKTFAFQPLKLKAVSRSKPCSLLNTVVKKDWHD